jgi:stage II sporulation protein AA (anti-sigma F factor antagonist)
MTESLSVVGVERTDVVVVILEGELDHATSGIFRAEVEERCDPAAEQLVLDLRRVALVDSAGLGALLRLGHRAAEGGRRLGLMSGEGAMLRRLLGITRLEEAFAVGDDLDAVRAVLAEPAPEQA